MLQTIVVVNLLGLVLQSEAQKITQVTPDHV